MSLFSLSLCSLICKVCWLNYSNYHTCYMLSFPTPVPWWTLLNHLSTVFHCAQIYLQHCTFRSDQKWPGTPLKIQPVSRLWTPWHLGTLSATTFHHSQVGKKKKKKESCFLKIFFLINLPLSNVFIPLHIYTLGLMGLHSPQAMRGEYEPHAESTAICSRIWLAMLKLPWRLEATCCCQQHPSGEDFPRFLDIPRTLISNRSIYLFVCLLQAFCSSEICFLSACSQLLSTSTKQTKWKGLLLTPSTSHHNPRKMGLYDPPGII